MDEATQRFARESAILVKMLRDGDPDSEAHARIAVTQAKTVKRAATVLVQELARHRDKLQPTEAQAHDRDQDPT